MNDTQLIASLLLSHGFMFMAGRFIRNRWMMKKIDKLNTRCAKLECELTEALSVLKQMKQKSNSL